MGYSAQTGSGAAQGFGVFRCGFHSCPVGVESSDIFILHFSASNWLVFVHLCCPKLHVKLAQIISNRLETPTYHEDKILKVAYGCNISICLKKIMCKQKEPSQKISWKHLKTPIIIVKGNGIKHMPNIFVELGVRLPRSRGSRREHGPVGKLPLALGRWKHDWTGYDSCEHFRPKSRVMGTW